MKRNEIQELLQQLPKPNPYTRWVNRERRFEVESWPWMQPERLAMYDPAFGWHLAKSFADEQLELPDMVLQPAILRANRSLLEPDPPDLQIALAQMLDLAASRQQYLLLKALLICEDLTIEHIAKLCGDDLEVVNLYEALFWSCRERKGERNYLAHICSEATAEELRSETRINLLELAHKRPVAAVVLRAAEMDHVLDQEIEIPTLYNQISKNSLNHAFRGLTKGAIGEKDNPALKPSLRIISRRLDHISNTEPERQRLSPEDSIKLVLDQIQRRAAGVSLSVCQSVSPDHENDFDEDNQLASVAVGVAKAENEVVTPTMSRATTQQDPNEAPPAAPPAPEAPGAPQTDPPPIETATPETQPAPSETATGGPTFGDRESHTDTPGPNIYKLPEFVAKFVPSGAAGEALIVGSWGHIPSAMFELIGRGKVTAEGASFQHRCWTVTKDADGQIMIEAGMNKSDPNKLGYLLTQKPWNHLEDKVVG